MQSKSKNGSKNPLKNKDFLSRLIHLEGKLMSDNYDYSVIEELVIAYTVNIIRNSSNSMIFNRIRLRPTLRKKFRFYYQQ